MLSGSRSDQYFKVYALNALARVASSADSTFLVCGFLNHSHEPFWQDLAPAKEWRDRNIPLWQVRPTVVL